MSRFSEHLLLEDKRTDFYEVCSCIGVICGPALGKKLKKLIDGGGGNTKALLDEVKKIAGSGGYDWNKSGVSQVQSITLDEPDMVNVCFNLVVGMNVFMQDVGYGIVGTKPYFIHNSINKYYKVEKDTFGEIPYTKANTADCIVSSIPHTQLLKELPKGAQADKSLQYIEMSNGGKYIQVSLKKDDADAQLGKVTKLVKHLYGVDSTASVSKRLSESYLSEGLWDKIKSVGASIWGKLKGMLGKFGSYVLKQFKKVNTKHLSEFERAMGINEGTMNAPTKKMVDHVLKYPEKAVNLVNNEAIKLQHMISNSNIAFNASLAKGFKVTNSGDVFKLIGNYLTIRMIQEIVSDEKKVSENVNRLIGEMFFGGTKMPLWKVFGYFGSNSYHYLGTLEAFVSQKKDPKIETMGVKMSSSGSFYTIYLYLLEEVNDNGKTYIVVRTGTNSSSRVTFIVEGTTKKGPFPHETPLSDIM